MAVTLVTNPNQSIDASPKRYFGLSTDTKPTVAVPGGFPDPTNGSEFLETDTGVLFVTYDGTNWVAVTGKLASETAVASTPITVAVTSTVIIAANASRRYLSIQNDSDETMYLGTNGGAAVLNKGRRLNANGGAYEMSKELGNLHFKAVYGICVSGGKNALVVEGT